MGMAPETQTTPWGLEYTIIGAEWLRHATGQLHERRVSGTAGQHQPDQLACCSQSVRRSTPGRSRPCFLASMRKV